MIEQYIQWLINLPLVAYLGMALWVIVCGIGYMLFNELEDESVNSHWEKPFLWMSLQFLNKNISWKNKWKLDENGNLIPNTEKKWYYFGFNPKYKERFTYSSTMLVFLTDGEHLFQFLKNIFIVLGMLAPLIIPAILFWIGMKIMALIKEKLNFIK